jgi:hypothetical protein
LIIVSKTIRRFIENRKIIVEAEKRALIKKLLKKLF